jgi:uncharacterized protein YcbK (DUF882 family)
MSMPVTQHFEMSEFASRGADGVVPYPAEWITDRLLPLCSMLEVIRATLGDRWMEVTPHGGYRTDALVASLLAAGHRVASATQHKQGRACDFIVEGMPPSDVHARILSMQQAGRLPLLGGLGLYAKFVHVDIREKVPPGHLARWEG